MQLLSEIVKTADITKYTVIWMHGLGADGHDFVPVIPELKLPTSLGIKFIFPHAPIRPVTLNNGMEMRAWYDLLSLDRSKTAKEDDILTSVSWINKLIDDEIELGTPSKNILLAGFSQGGVIALHAGLRYPERLGGILALSTYLPFVENLIAESSVNQKKLPIFAAHGEHDPVILFSFWQEYVAALELEKYQIESKAYSMEHSLCLEEINHISAWLQKYLS